MKLMNASVLVVDDELLLSDIVARWFIAAGSRVLLAQSGEDALRLLPTRQVDVLLTDVHMPYMSGIELVTRMRSSILYMPRVLFMSGFSDIEVREAYNLGVVGIIEKPFSHADLFDYVQKALTDSPDQWSSSPDSGARIELHEEFDSLDSAIQRGSLALGRGGLCLATTMRFMRDQRVTLRLVFKEENHSLLGQGIVRWVSSAERRIGIELIYVDERERGWFASLPEVSQALAFIPAGSVLSRTRETDSVQPKSALSETPIIIESALRDTMAGRIPRPLQTFHSR